MHEDDLNEYDSKPPEKGRGLSRIRTPDLSSTIPEKSAKGKSDLEFNGEWSTLSTDMSRVAATGVSDQWMRQARQQDLRRVNSNEDISITAKNHEVTRPIC